MTRSAGREHGQVLHITKIRALVSTGVSALQVETVTVQCRAAQGRKRSAQMCFQKLPWLAISTCTRRRNPGLRPETRPGRPFPRFARLCHRILPKASPHHHLASPRRFIVRAPRIACRCTGCPSPQHVVGPRPRLGRNRKRPKSEPGAQHVSGRSACCFGVRRQSTVVTRSSA